MNPKETNRDQRTVNARQSGSQSSPRRFTEKSLAVCLGIVFLLAFACKPRVNNETPPSKRNEQAEQTGTIETSDDGHSESANATEPTFAVQLQRIVDGTSDSILVLQSVLDDAQFAALDNLEPKEREQIRELIIDQGSLTVPSIRIIASLPNLQHLRIRNTAIDDESAGLLASIRSLRMLNLPQSELSDDGLREFSKLPNLELLRLSSTRLTDTGVRELRAHPTLLFVHLINVPFGKDGLLALASIPNLQSLYIDGTELPNEAWNEFFQIRDDVHVHLDQFHHDLDPGRHDHEQQ